MKHKFKRPETTEGSYVSEQSDATMIELLRNGQRLEGIRVTEDQLKKLARFYGLELRKENILFEAADRVDTLQEARTDGLRLMAFLAKYDILEEGVDPVKSLAWALQQDFFRSPPDIWNEEENE